MKSTTALVLAGAGLAAAGCPKSCYSDPSSLQLSCHNFTAANDLCCFNSPGGAILQTQFWDYNPQSGPADHWTIHGLWPDHCDGTYDQYCDETRQYTNITQILQSYGQQDLVSYMRNYWTDYHGQEESFWEHEWGKHGTCMSTLNTKCYSNYSPQEEVVDYFRRTVTLFQGLDTHAFLQRAGIEPSSNKNYTLTQVNNALQAARGVTASVQCDNTGALTQVYYYYNTVGSISQGLFVPSNADGAKSNCPASLQYLPKKNGTAYPVQTPSASASATKTLQQGPTCRPNGI